MAISASASAIDPAGSKHRQGVDSAARSDRVAKLALKAFMSMNRAVAIVGPDGTIYVSFNNFSTKLLRLACERPSQPACPQRNPTRAALGIL